MRINVKPSTVQNVQAVRLFHSLFAHTLLIQVFDPVSVFLALDSQTLTREVDAAGNPKAGFVITQGPPLQLFDFKGELWAACNVATSIEFGAWLKIL